MAKQSKKSRQSKQPKKPNQSKKPKKSKPSLEVTSVTGNGGFWFPSRSLRAKHENKFIEGDLFSCDELYLKVNLRLNGCKQGICKLTELLSDYDSFEVSEIVKSSDNSHIDILLWTPQKCYATTLDIIEMAIGIERKK